MFSIKQTRDGEPPTEQEKAEAQHVNNAQQNLENQSKELLDKVTKTLSQYKTTVGGGNNSYYNSIIYESYKVGAKQRANDGVTDQSSDELCSILDQYSWTTDTFILSKNAEGIRTQAPVPHCYLVQFQQLHSSNITNFINMMAAIGNAVTDTDTVNAFNNAAEKVGQLYSALQAAVNTYDTSIPDVEKPKTSPQPQQGKQGDNKQEEKPDTSSVNLYKASGKNLVANLLKGFGTLWTSVANQGKGIQNNIMNSTYLAPYRLMYSLNPTKQKYVFPMISQPPINKVINTYGEKQQGNSILSSQNMYNWVSKLADGTVNLVRDMKDLSYLVSGHGSTSYSLSHVQKAKFFQYPQQTQEYTITFPLLNTVKSNDGVPNWKKNYKFIFLFTLKNMVFRRDNGSFFPPLFYDLIIPGVIRQPFCYVKEVNVKPLGVVRMMSFDDLATFAGGGKTYQVAVPQAWIVTIKLKSLLATTSNMVLSSLHDLSINASVTTLGNANQK